eukprot:TRINITY_DN91899_c0_g1_i1.p1 TRINITY_DN91899_c0_g1~~TRINITY_DN91899_c0_g1_i1.p1  ORF type:complete len:298 (+),score=37.03 TRINITY_DN91899_c0_g1_i1:178-1071(+)
MCRIALISFALLCLEHVPRMSVALDFNDGAQATCIPEHLQLDEYTPRHPSFHIPQDSKILRLGHGKLPGNSWLQRLPCHDTKLDSVASVLEEGRRKWRSPPHSSLCCFPKQLPAKQNCFRSVFDDRIDLTKEQDPEVSEEDRQDYLLHQMKHILTSEFGIQAESIHGTSGRRQLVSRCPSCFGRGSWHVDYHESNMFLFSAILYLGEMSEEHSPERLHGGWTLFANVGHLETSDKAVKVSENGTVELFDGVLIAPKRGRLVLFTGGSENLHSAGPVEAGTRASYQVWFSCNCSEAGS